MKLITFFFGFVVVISLLFLLYFGLAPIFDQPRFEPAALATGRILSLSSYSNFAWIMAIVFAASSVCLTWLTITAEKRQVNE